MMIQPREQAGQTPNIRHVVVLHSCDNPICVNPAHLSLGTQAQNIRDSHAKGRFAAWHRTGVRLDGTLAKHCA